MNTENILSPDKVNLLVRQLAVRLVWVAPVGNDEWKGEFDLCGFMVCRRVVNNADGKNTRVDYLRLTKDRWGGWWKTPFRDQEHMFPTFDAALLAAATVENLLEVQ